MEMIQIEWNRTHTEKFISLYEKERVLWDMKAKNHKNTKLRSEALFRMANKMEIDVMSIQKKIVSVRSQFYREYSRKMKKLIEPSWYGYKKLLFLLPFAENIKHVSKNINDTLSEINPTGQIEHIEQNNIVKTELQENSEFQSKIENDYIQENSDTFVNESVDEYQFQDDNSTHHNPDIFTTFGEYVAESLRNLNDTKIQSWARYQISQIIYNAEMSGISQSSSLSKNYSNDNFYLNQSSSSPTNYPNVGTHFPSS